MLRTLSLLKLFVELILIFLLFSAAAHAGSSPQAEVDDAILFLAAQPQEDREYIKFLSLYNIPDISIRIPQDHPDTGVVRDDKNILLRDAFITSLNFWTHSMSSGAIYRNLQFVSGSDSLLWMDIRNFNWTGESWEFVSLRDPYFREPWISYKSGQTLRVLGGNAVVRGDWFLTYTSDNMKQIDVNAADTPFYYVLLYAKSGVPKTLDDFRARWYVDSKKIEELPLARLFVIDKDDSEVARHNRQLAFARTELGYYTETSDTKTNINNQDYVETLQPQVLGRDDRDAGEQITTNFLGLQVYFLTDGKNNRIEFADGAIAVDRNDSSDPRVRVPRSCIICHEDGMNDGVDAMKALLADKVKLKVYDKEFAKQVESSYFNSELPKLCKENNAIFSEAVRKVTGWHPPQVVSAYRQCVGWYEQRLDIEQCARETGVSVDVFKEKVARGITGRLGGLFNETKPNTRKPTIVRETWDNPKGGLFAQAMLLIHSLPASEEIRQQVVEKAVRYVECIYDAPLRVGEKVLIMVPKGTKLEVSSEQNGFVEVQYGSKKGFLWRQHVK